MLAVTIKEKLHMETRPATSLGVEDSGEMEWELKEPLSKKQIFFPFLPEHACREKGEAAACGQGDRRKKWWESESSLSKISGERGRDGQRSPGKGDRVLCGNRRKQRKKVMPEKRKEHTSGDFLVKLSRKVLEYSVSPKGEGVQKHFFARAE